MFWLAEVGEVPIINLASCRMWTGSTVGDLMLPLLMAGERVTPEEIVEIGYGGLPGSAVNLRFPAYDTGETDVQRRARPFNPQQMHAG